MNAYQNKKFTETNILMHFYKKNSWIPSLFSMTFHDFPWPRLFSKTFQAWKMVLLNSPTFRDFPGRVVTLLISTYMPSVTDMANVQHMPPRHPIATKIWLWNWPKNGRISLTKTNSKKRYSLHQESFPIRKDNFFIDTKFANKYFAKI